MRIANANGRRLALLALVVVAASLVASGCGSNDETPTTGAEATWADGLCSAFATWKSSIQGVGASLKDVDQLSQAKIEDASKQVSAANDKLVDDVQALGEPPTSGGEEAKSAINNLSQELQASADKVKDATDDVATLTDAVQAVNVASAALLSMSSEIGTTLTTLESLDVADEWKQAFADSESCRSLRQS